jgi:hypothetical protein
VLVEAGDRCAIPTCRQHPVQVHHIEGYALQPEHRFSDLIALCATCHDRVTRGQIDRLAVRRYKANLAILNSRYEPFERRVLLDLAQQAGERPAFVTPGGLGLFFGNLLADGLIVEQDQMTGEQLPPIRMGFNQVSRWELTAKGRAVAVTILGAELLDPDDEPAGLTKSEPFRAP